MSPREVRKVVRVSWRDVGPLVPWVLVAWLAGWLLARQEVPLASIAAFALVQAFGYAVPGLVVWRLLRGRNDTLFADVVPGWVISHAIVLGIYALARLVGVPRAVWAYPVIVLALSAMPRWRRVWRRGDVRTPLWFGWGVAAALAAVLWWFLRFPGPAFRARWPNTDAPYLIAQAAELKHHFPPVLPFIAGEPLDYHWFTFLDVAALSWQSGLPLDLLTNRLVPLTAIVLSLLGMALLGRHLAASEAVGLASAWTMVLVGSTTLIVTGGLYPWVTDGAFLGLAWFPSPTMAFAFQLLPPLVLVVVDVMRHRARVPWGWWLLLAVLTAALTGAKVTGLPVIGAGVLAVVARGLVVQRRLPRAAFAIGLLLALELVLAQVVLYGGSTQGLRLEDWSGLRMFWMASGLVKPTAGLALGMSTLVVFGWLTPLPAALVLTRTRERDDPGVWFVLGMGLAGLVAAASIQHPGYSQMYFLRGALPFVDLLAAWGLVVGWQRSPARYRRVVLASMVSGLVVALLLRRHASGIAVENLTAADVREILVIALLTLLAAAAAGWVRSRGRRRGADLLVLLTVGACFMGMGAARSYLPLHPAASPAPTNPARVPLGGPEAAAYLRSHAAESDLLATNAHCVLPRTEAHYCDNRAHWIAAWAERRVVLEGWGYTPRALAGSRTMGEALTKPFWDPALLALNDAVFTNPSTSTLSALTSRFPVWWLVVDDRFPADLPALKAAVLDHRQFGDVWVFRLPPMPPIS